jgi:prepilin-type N-terminal cleavage/methylation domain-containing protein
MGICQRLVCDTILVMKVGNKNQTGFTIVELLIVIVVIGILAAITVVAFGSTQSKARNAQTLSSAAAWAKAMHLYKTDNGGYPTINSCLGTIGTYGSTTDATKNNGRCYGSSTDGTWMVNQSFLNQINPYMQKYSEPADYDITQGSGTNRYRGIMYYRNNGSGTMLEEFRVMLEAVSSCPGISGLDASYTAGAYTGGRMCFYRLPQ